MGLSMNQEYEKCMVGETGKREMRNPINCEKGGIYHYIRRIRNDRTAEANHLKIELANKTPAANT